MQLSGRLLYLICWTIANWAFSFGVGSQLVSHWLHAQRQSDTVIGYSHAFYYFGMAAASFALPLSIRRLGSIPCVMIGMILSGISLAAFPWTHEEWAWYALRAVNGWAGALCVIPLETIVSQTAAPALKTRYFAYYGVAVTVGGALGFAAAPPLGSLNYPWAFAVGGMVPVLACVLIPFGMHAAAPVDGEDAGVPMAWLANFLAYATAWCQGFLEGGMVAFLQLFLVSVDFSDDTAGALMGVTTIGVILFQIPVSWLADRFGKTPVLLVCYGVVAVCLVAIPALTHLLALAAILFTFGGCTGAMYPLGLSMLGDRVPVNGLARAYAWFLIVECIGSVAGAAALGLARDEWGPASMFDVSFITIEFILFLALAAHLIERWRARSVDAPPPSRYPP